VSCEKRSTDGLCHRPVMGFRRPALLSALNHGSASDSGSLSTPNSRRTTKNTDLTPNEIAATLAKQNLSRFIYLSVETPETSL